MQASDSRWSSNYRAVRAVPSNLLAIIMSLQDIHTTGQDLSSEAGGLLLIFQDITMIYLIFNLSDILQPLHILSQQLQCSTMCLAEVPDKVNATINRLKEKELDSASVTETVNTFLENCKEHGIGLVGDNNIDVHSTIVQPYKNKIIKHMIHRLQNKGLNSIARVEQIFNPKNMIPDDIKYREKDIQVFSEEVGVTNVGDVVSE